MFETVIYRHQWLLLFWYQSRSIRIFCKSFESLESSFWCITCFHDMGDFFHFFCVTLVRSYVKATWSKNSIEKWYCFHYKKTQFNWTNFYKSLLYKITPITIIIFDAILWQHMNFLITWRAYPNTTYDHNQLHRRK